MFAVAFKDYNLSQAETHLLACLQSTCTTLNDTEVRSNRPVNTRIMKKIKRKKESVFKQHVSENMFPERKEKNA